MLEINILYLISYISYLVSSEFSYTGSESISLLPEGQRL